MTAAVLASVLGGSLLGSLHCAGMCGGFVAFCGAAGAGGQRGVELTWSLGRLVGYATLGAAAGSLGSALDLAGRAAGLGRVALPLAGGVMVLTGLAWLLVQAGLFRWTAAAGRASRLFGPLLRRLASRPPLARALLLGVATALLPCGWLWAFVVAAAGTGAPLHGALLMGAFWLGTLPALLGVGVLLGAATSRLRAHLPWVTASVLVLAGLVTLASRGAVPLLRGTENRTALPGCCHP